MKNWADAPLPPQEIPRVSDRLHCKANVRFFFSTIAMVDEHCVVMSELFECDFTELYILGSDH